VLLEFGWLAVLQQAIKPERAEAAFAATSGVLSTRPHRAGAPSIERRPHSGLGTAESHIWRRPVKRDRPCLSGPLAVAQQAGVNAALVVGRNRSRCDLLHPRPSRLGDPKDQCPPSRRRTQTPRAPRCGSTPVGKPKRTAPRSALRQSLPDSSPAAAPDRPPSGRRAGGTSRSWWSSASSSKGFAVARQHELVLRNCAVEGLAAAFYAVLELTIPIGKSSDDLVWTRSGVPWWNALAEAYYLSDDEAMPRRFLQLSHRGAFLVSPNSR
jgi:hypothetical protein